MSIPRRILLAATFAVVIMLAGRTAAQAQCPPGWTHKLTTISMVFPGYVGCLMDVDYCIDPTATQIVILGYREVLPGCPGLPPDQELNGIEKGVMAVEHNKGDYWGEACTGAQGVVTYNISRHLCYQNLGPSLGYIACQGGTCDKTYVVQCLGGSFVYTLIAGPTMNGTCQPNPGQSCINVPCN